MGIYVQTYADRPKKRLFGSPLEKQIVQSAQKWSIKIGLGELFKAYAVRPNLVEFTFYPLNERLSFELSETQVSIGIKTSTVGAGYHAKIIELCDYLENQLGLKWRWKLSNGESGDESGYALSRDFDELRGKHFKQVTSIANHFVENDLWGGMVHCPTDVFHVHNEIAGPRGYLTRQLLEDFELDDQDAIVNIWNNLTFWNEKEIDQDFWLALLEGLFWCEYPWRPAETDQEAYIESCINTCIEKTDESNFSDELAAGVSSYRQACLGRRVQSNSGMGYYRKRLIKDISGPWQCQIPGYMIESWDDEYNTAVFIFDGVELRGSSMAIEYSESKDVPFDWPDYLSNSRDVVKERFSYRIPLTAESQENGTFFGMGIGVTPVLGTLRQIVYFSVTGANEEIVLTELTKQFASGIRYVERE